jgi:hypothetical protein
MELSPLHACKHDNGPWFINKAISISIISGKIAAIGINKEVELRAMLFNSSRYNPRVPPREYMKVTSEICLASQIGYIYVYIKKMMFGI